MNLGAEMPGDSRRRCARLGREGALDDDCGGIPSGLAARYQIRVIDESAIRLRFEVLAPVLDEQGRRRFAAAEAMAAGPGGVSAVMRATGIARSTIRRGVDELVDGDAADGERVRRAGGGRNDGCESRR
jgi:hypothetical protein